MNEFTPSKEYVEKPKPIESNIEISKLRIRFEGKFKSITTFDWNNIPEFAVITGINGTGKSQLLELIHNTVISNPKFPSRVEITGKTIRRNEVTYLRGEWHLDATSRVSLATIQGIREGLYNEFLNSANNPGLPDNRIRVFEAFEEIKRAFGKNQTDISIEEFNQAFPEILVENENQLSTKIGEIFLIYRLDEIDLLSKHCPEAEINDKLGEKPWNVLRRILETAKLPFNINDPSTNSLRDPFHLKLTHQISNEDVPFYDLSSGEKVLMSLMFYLYNSQEKGVFPRLFLLDEPDAHLHPTMSHQFINVMKKILVDELGVQVIMTTHSPSTIALAPEEAIFVAYREGERIRKVNKDAALKLLTSGVPSFSVNYENRRQVFVESKYDVYYYEKIYRKISDMLEPEVSLSFIASGETRTDKHGTPISSCDQVINVTNILRESGNKFVWGIVDWDKENKESDFIKVLGNGTRYSIENYLFDPILVVALLLREKFVGKEELGLPVNATLIDFKIYDNEQLQKLADFVIQKLEAEINPQNQDAMTVQLLNGKEINIPSWYLHYQGHELESKILEAFPKLNAIKRNSEDALKNAIIDKVIDDIPELISLDFCKVFTQLQAV